MKSGPWTDLNVSSRGYYNYNSGSNGLSSLSSLSKLTSCTKSAIKYLWVNCNRLITLEGLEDFNHLIYLNAYNNKLNNVNVLR